MYGSCACSLLISIQRDGKKIIACYLILCKDILKKDEAKQRLTKLLMIWSIIKMLSSICQWLIALKITKKYCLEMKNMMEVSNRQVSLALR